MHASEQPYTILRYTKVTVSSPLLSSTCTWSNTVPSSTANTLRTASAQWQRKRDYIYPSIPLACPRQAPCPPLRSATSNRPEDDVRTFRSTIHRGFAPNRANHTNSFDDDDETSKPARKHQGNGHRDSPAPPLRRGLLFEHDERALPGTLCLLSMPAVSEQPERDGHQSTRNLASYSYARDCKQQASCAVLSRTT